MNPLLDNTDEEEVHVRRSVSSSGSDREITLGTTMILLIFFALAVYGAALFGFGYSMGGKRSSVTALASAPIVTPSSNASKPAPGRPGTVTIKAPAADASATPEPPSQSRTVTLPVDSAENDKTSPAAVARPPLAPPVPVTPSTAPAPAPTLVVQVAAVSHKEDADLIASTLQHRGYTVNINNEADKLLHIQVGPFTNRKDAEAMRARLLADGFNAYIK